MDRFLAPHSPEAIAYGYLNELGSPWDADLSLDEALVAGCAAYQALDRYLGGADIFILPRSRTELESILRRYSYDAIHNTIAKSRSTLQPGGYSRVCNLAEQSIRGVLNTSDNAKILLALHAPRSASRILDRDEPSPRSIKTQ